MASLNENFKIKNGLTVNTTISAGSCAEASCFIVHDGTSSQFLKADGSLDSAVYTTCDGDITAVTTGNGLSGGGLVGDVEIGLDSTVVRTTSDQTIGGVKTFTDSLSAEGAILSGGIDLFDIFAGGDITEVTTTGIYLTGGGTSGSVNIGVDSACGSSWNSTATTVTNNSPNWDSVYTTVDANSGNWDQSACPGLLCEGDITAVVAADGLTGTALAGDATLAVDTTVVRTASAQTIGGVKTFTSAISAESQILSSGTDLFDIFLTESNPGDITEITLTGGLSGDSLTSGNVCIGIDASTYALLDQSGCSGINCTGDITGVTAGFALTGGGTFGQLEVGLDSTCNTKWDQSGCSGINCVGDITAVIACAGLSGTALAGDACIGIDAGTAANFDQSACPGINCTGNVTNNSSTLFTNKSGSNLQWTNDAGYTDCLGVVTSITESTGITIGGTAAVPTVAVDSSVVRTTGDQCITGTKVFSNTIITSGLSATGTVTANCLTTGAVMEANVDVQQVYPQGLVLEINPRGCIVESTTPDSKLVFGVAAGDTLAPIVMGAEPICMTGDICVGDFITTSDKPGHGKRTTQPYPYGTVIGQAMESGCGESYSIKAMIRKM